MSFTELKDRGPMGRLAQGGQPAHEVRWAGDRHLTTSPTSNPLELRKEAALAAMASSPTSTSRPAPTSISTSQQPTPDSSPAWTSNFGLQTTTTAQPRPVFSPQASYSYRPSSSLPRRQPSASETYMPQSNSDLLVGTMDQRDPYAMETPLTTGLDIPVAPPPPHLSGGRLGAIILV